LVTFQLKAFDSTSKNYILYAGDIVQIPVSLHEDPTITSLCPATVVTLVGVSPAAVPSWITIVDVNGSPHIKFEVPYTPAAVTNSNYTFQILRDGVAKKAAPIPPAVVGLDLDPEIILEVKAPC
jgi:hypothetical protein